ncbi:MAG: hypothetical protein A2046_17125 [Bacteroidetes bacterium GWA2_30_7]|nr:MAG: hypothetical protein A2046_17125 [Bacteroidetes bacterium GWA2_30_7]
MKSTKHYIKNLFFISSLFILLSFITSDNNDNDFNYLPATDSSDQIIKHSYYTLSYVEEWEQPKWVAYKLTSEMVKGKTQRVNDFRIDTLVKTSSATLEDYLKSGYDKGHLCPAGDMKFSKQAMSETFYMSNMSPQKPYFNRGIWKKLEAFVRQKALSKNLLYIVTGGIISDTAKYIGANKVSVPESYYKVIYCPNMPDCPMIAFVLKNEKSKQQLSIFTLTVDSLEKLTKIDFFSALPDSLETNYESNSKVNSWFIHDIKLN